MVSPHGCAGAVAVRHTAWLWTFRLYEGYYTANLTPRTEPDSCVFVQEIKLLTAMWVPARVAAAEAVCARLRGALLGTPGCEHKALCTIVPSVDGKVYTEADLQQLQAGEVLGPPGRMSRYLHPQLSKVCSQRRSRTLSCLQSAKECCSGCVRPCMVFTCSSAACGCQASLQLQVQVQSCLSRCVISTFAACLR